MKNIWLLTFCLSLFFVSCNDTNKRSIKYVASGAISAYNLQYLNSDNELVVEEVMPQSAQDQWSYSYIVDEGDIVYINGNYKDINSSLKLMVLIDGKIYKQASNTNDTLSYLVVSGTVPY